MSTVINILAKASVHFGDAIVQNRPSSYSVTLKKKVCSPRNTQNQHSRSRLPKIRITTTIDLLGLNILNFPILSHATIFRVLFQHEYFTRGGLYCVSPSELDANREVNILECSLRTKITPKNRDQSSGMCLKRQQKLL